MEKLSKNGSDPHCQAVRVWLCAFFISMMAVASQADATEKKLAPQQMSIAERQNWASTMLERLDQANRVVLDPKYVILQQKRFNEQVQPLLEGTSPEKARKIIKMIRDEVENVERVAIEHLDHQFRQTLDRSFQRKSEQTLRRQWFEGWKKTIQAWQKSTDRDHRLHVLIGWLQKSKSALKEKQYATVTSVPRFSEPTVVKKPTIPEQLATIKKSKVKTPTAMVVPPNKRRTPPEIPPGLLVDPSEDRPLPPRHVAKKPMEHLSPTRPGKPGLDINLSELNAQISGNNMALRRLEAKLITDERWTANQIDPFAKQLKQIAVRVADTQMVHRLLSLQQQRQADRIIDPSEVLKTLRSKILAARIAVLQDQDSSASPTQEQRAELRHLDRLSGELDKIDPGAKQSSP